MISTFNLMKLNSLLEDFHKLTKIRITVFDENFHELASCPEQIAPFCQIIRIDPKARLACRKCDEKACIVAARCKKTFNYRCHAGMTESIAPLFMGNLLIGYLLFGHVFSYHTHEEGWEQIKELCQSYQIDKEKLKEACFNQPIISHDYIESASHILQAVAYYLCMERMVSLHQQELPVQIDQYISAHFTEKISAALLCKEFQIGKTHLYEIARQNYDVGIAEHIRNLRIEKAKDLLLHCPELSLREISSQCGFKDYNYFITVFRQTTGVSPKRYIQNNPHNPQAV